MDSAHHTRWTQRMADTASKGSKQGISGTSKCLEEVQKLLDCAVAEAFDQPRCWKLLKELRTCVEKGGVQDFTLLTPADCSGSSGGESSRKEKIEKEHTSNETREKEAEKP